MSGFSNTVKVLTGVAKFFKIIFKKNTDFGLDNMILFIFVPL